MNEFNNLGDIMAYVLEQLGKDIQGGYISPEDFTNACNAIQLILINEYLDQYEHREEITMDLVPFTKTAGDDEVAPLYPNAYGKVALPADCIYTSRSNYTKYTKAGCVTNKQYRSITLLSQMDFDAAMNTPMLNPLNNPIEVEPIMVIQNGKILVVPPLPQISLTYIAKPPAVYFDYDEIDGENVYLPPGQVHVNGSVQPIGSPSLSVEFAWRKQTWPELANRLVKNYAVADRSQFNLQTLEPPKV